MARTSRIIVGALAALALGGAAAAQDDDPTTVSEVTVTARTADAVKQFVEGMSEPTSRGAELLARWNRTICPATVGLPERQGAFINDTIARTALQLKLKVAEPGCRPDVLIVVTPDAAALTEALATTYKASFKVDADSDADVSSPGRDAYEAFLNSTRPVRWWHVSELASSEGRPVRYANMIAGRPVGGVMIVESSSVSRLRSPVRQDFAHILIVVDAEQAQGLSFDSLAGYLTMVTLAQVNPEADLTGLPTILNLFEDRAAGRPVPNGLTDWDLDYLKGLYLQRGDAPDLSRQQGRIKREMREGQED